MGLGEQRNGNEVMVGHEEHGTSAGGPSDGQCICLIFKTMPSLFPTTPSPQGEGENGF